MAVFSQIRKQLNISMLIISKLLISNSLFDFMGPFSENLPNTLSPSKSLEALKQMF